MESHTMKHITLSLLAHILIARLTPTSLGWLDSLVYSSPSSIDNKFTNDRKQGSNWNDLKVGEFSVYKNISFHCLLSSNQFNIGNMNNSHGSPDRGFQENFINGLVLFDEVQTPRFGLGQLIEVSSFLSTKIFVPIEFDCDLESYYDLADHSVCKQRTAYSKVGLVIENAQYADSTSVTVLYPKQTTVSEKIREGYHFGVHSIEFNCNPATSAPWISSTSAMSVATTIAIGILALPTSDIGITEKYDDHDDETNEKQKKKGTSIIEIRLISKNPNIIDASLPFIHAHFKNNTLSNGDSAIIFTPKILVTVIKIIITDSMAYTQTTVQPIFLTVHEVAFTTTTIVKNKNYKKDVGLVSASPRVTETKAWSKNPIAQVTSSLNPLTSEGSKIVATSCVLGAAFIFAAAIVL